MADKFRTVRSIAFSIYFAGLMFILVTKNVKVQLLISIGAMLLVCFDYYVLTPQPVLSLSGVRDADRLKFRLSPLMFGCFALIIASCVYMSHIRLSAVLMMSGLLLLVLDRYTKASPIFTRK
jgi:hypothetical protein